MDLTYPILLSTTAVLILLFYRYLVSNYDYWKEQGIPCGHGLIPGFGHIGPSIFMKKHLATVMKEIYEANPGSSMVGLYTLRQPLLLIRDADLHKAVMQSEFNSFRHHQTTDSTVDPLFVRNPFFLNDQEWRDSRSKFVTIVTTNKLKIYNSVVLDGASKFVQYVNEELERQSFIELEGRGMFEKITMAIAANAILSVEEGSFDESTPSIFRNMRKSLFEPSTVQATRYTILQFLPILNKIFRIGFVPYWTNIEFSNIVNHHLKNRRNGGIEKNDVLQHLIECCREKNLPDQAVISDAFSFLIETSGTTSMTMSFLACDLAERPHVQEKLRKEINSVIRKFNGEISYEAVNEMSYLDQVMSESMRLNPVGGTFRKICSETIDLVGPDGLKCKVNPGDRVIVSVYGIHRNPKYWKDPEEFRPERFDKASEECQQRDKHVYMPFGKGPRMCPGMRMAILQMKIVIVMIIKNFVIEKSPKLREPIALDPRISLSFIDGGAWIRLKHLP